MLIREIIHSLNYPLPDSSTPVLDRELMLSLVLASPREQLYTNGDRCLTERQMEDWQQLYQRRLSGEPMAYLLGYRDFWNQRLMVNHSVLIPRPETEGLVELLLREIRLQEAIVADLGTGSGAIGIALASERLNWHVWATDLNQEALSVARYNTEQFKLKNMHFSWGNWLTALPNFTKLDAIVANPPYLAQDDPHLNSSIRFEPSSALVAAQDGFADLFDIIKHARSYLKFGGILALEHGCQQAERLSTFWRDVEGYDTVTTELDIAGLPRISWARRA